jgi:hypothetical protein
MSVWKLFAVMGPPPIATSAVVRTATNCHSGGPAVTRPLLWIRLPPPGR